MSSAKRGAEELGRWLLLVGRRWLWLLGLIPAIIAVLFTYLPRFPQVRFPLLWSLGFALLGIVISAFLVHLDLRARLLVYEEQEPRYGISILEASSRACAPDQLHVEVTLRIAPETPWLGQIVAVRVDSAGLPSELGSPVVTSQEYKPLDWHCKNLLKLPYDIPSAGCDFQFTLHFPMAPSPQTENKREELTIRMQLLIGYVTQPVGYVQKCLYVDIPVGLRKAFDDLASPGDKETS